jgi:hypothetical protein
LFQPRLLGPLFAACTCVSLQCTMLHPPYWVPLNFAVVDLGTICSFFCPHQPPILALTSFLRVVSWISFMFKFHSRWWLLMLLYVPAVSLHPLQAVWMSLIAGTTFFTLQPTYLLIWHLLPVSWSMPVIFRLPVLIHVNVC